MALAEKWLETEEGRREQVKIIDQTISSMNIVTTVENTDENTEVTLRC